MDNIYVYTTNLPPKVNEMVAPCIDGYTIYLSDRLSYDGRCAAYNHALGHIKNNDFEKVLADEVEQIAHKN